MTSGVRRAAVLERSRPALGTLVVLRLHGDVDAVLERAADAAFAAIDEVHRLMSFHDPASDVRTLARARPGERVRVSPATAHVLARAQAFARASGGAFDAGCGARAVAAGWLPRPEDAAPAGDLPFEDALVIEAGGVVHCRSTVWLDVGGIAKGQAVDRAVAAARRAGARGGVVNAGGDLRVFGETEETIWLRAPHDASRLVPVATLRDGACATSARGEVAARPGARVDPEAASRTRSVTVFAPTALAADALAKVVWLQGEAARALLRRCRARALRITDDGGTTRL